MPTPDAPPFTFHVLDSVGDIRRRPDLPDDVPLVLVDQSDPVAQVQKLYEAFVLGLETAAMEEGSRGELAELVAGAISELGDQLRYSLLPSISGMSDAEKAAAERELAKEWTKLEPRPVVDRKKRSR